MESKSLNKLFEKVKNNPMYANLDTIKKKILNEIIKYFKLKLNEYTKDLFVGEKININHAVLIDLSKKSIFMKNSESAFEVTKWLKKYKYVSSKSKLYPVNSRYMTSTLPNSLIQIDLPTMDKILRLRDDLLVEYKNAPDIGLYIFLRLYQIKIIDKEDIMKIDMNTNIFKLNNNLYLFVSTHDKHSRGYQPLIKYIFDSKIIDFIHSSGVVAFDKSLKIYEKEVRKYTEKYDLYFNDVKQSIQFEYAYKSCQFNLTLKNQSNYPHLNLAEIEYLFPNTIPQEFLDIEKMNENIYFNVFEQYANDIDFDDEILDINYKATTYITYDIESFDLLKECTNVPLEHNKFDLYLKKYYKIISEFKKRDTTSYLYSIFDFVEILLKKADKNFTKHSIKKTTLKEYLRIMFTYCFNYIVIEGELSSNVFKEIKENINIYENESLFIKNTNITEVSSKVYYRLIKLFWKKYTNFKTETSIQMIVDIKRSVVFENELTSFIKMLETETKIMETSKDIKFRKLFQPVFCLILFYSGLRKTELRTLLTKNIELVNDKEFEISVTKENFKLARKAHNELELKEKTEHAIRLVRFSVKNLAHFNLIKKYLTFIEKKKCKFTFPFISEKGTITKTKPMKDSFISTLPKRLSDHTGRYTPLHSLRHSYATFKTISLFQESELFLVYELSHSMGHSEPSVTLENYIHIDLLDILKHIDTTNIVPDLKTDYSNDLK